MRVFLDACVDPRVVRLLAEHFVSTAFDTGWHGLSDSELLLRVQAEFDVFVTMDRGFEFQHNVRKLSIGIVIVHVVRNKVEFYRKLTDDLQIAVDDAKPGVVTHVPQQR
jgi:hypothetical protein